MMQLKLLRTLMVDLAIYHQRRWFIYPVNEIENETSLSSLE